MPASMLAHTFSGSWTTQKTDPVTHWHRFLLPFPLEAAAALFFSAFELQANIKGVFFTWITSWIWDVGCIFMQNLLPCCTCCCPDSAHAVHSNLVTDSVFRQHVFHLLRNVCKKYEVLMESFRASHSLWLTVHAGEGPFHRMGAVTLPLQLAPEKEWSSDRTSASHKTTLKASVCEFNNNNNLWSEE